MFYLRVLVCIRQNLQRSYSLLQDNTTKNFSVKEAETMNNCVFYQPPDCILFNTKLFDCVMCRRTVAMNPYDREPEPDIPDIPWRPWGDDEDVEQSYNFLLQTVSTYLLSGQSISILILGLAIFTLSATISLGYLLVNK
jgi:hypothetical protein